MPPSTIHIELETLLGDMYECLSKLALTLSEEFEALAATNIDQLQLINVTKLELTETLDKLEERRTHHLRNANLPVNEMGMLALLNRHANRPDDHLFHRWNMIKELTRECSQQNEVNGIIVDNQHHHVQNALAILTGRSQLQSDTYNAHGKSAQRTSGNTLARA